MSATVAPYPSLSKRLSSNKRRLGSASALKTSASASSAVSSTSAAENHGATSAADR